MSRRLEIRDPPALKEQQQPPPIPIPKPIFALGDLKWTLSRAQCVDRYAREGHENKIEYLGAFIKAAQERCPGHEHFMVTCVEAAVFNMLADLGR